MVGSSVGRGYTGRAKERAGKSGTLWMLLTAEFSGGSCILSKYWRFWISSIVCSVLSVIFTPLFA